MGAWVTVMGNSISPPFEQIYAVVSILPWGLWSGERLNVISWELAAKLAGVAVIASKRNKICPDKFPPPVFFMLMLLWLVEFMARWVVSRVNMGLGCSYFEGVMISPLFVL